MISNNSVIININESLYGLAFKRLQNCQPSFSGIIRFPIVFQRLGASFSLPKREVWNLLFVLRDFGLIKFVKCQGIRITERKKSYRININQKVEGAF